mmetsp:Transcript_32350/g.92828  ORF Transcript_32350/g.92828 Transcript_32350/m.92828 type:complete len:496 (+) Transcript_32350:543-2030(+)
MLHGPDVFPDVVLQLRCSTREPTPAVATAAAAGLAPAPLRRPLLSGPQFLQELPIVVDAQLAPDPAVPVPRAAALLNPGREQCLVHQRQPLAREALQLPDPGAGAPAGAGALAPGHHADLREAVGVEHHGELVAGHPVAVGSGHLVEDHIGKRDGLGCPLGLLQQFVGGLGAEVALHQKHGPLDAVLPLGVYLRTSKYLTHGLLKLTLCILCDLVVLATPRDVHPEDVRPADGQAVAVLQRLPSGIDKAAVHAHEPRVQRLHPQHLVVLVAHATDPRAYAEAGDLHLAKLSTSAYRGLANWQVIDQTALQGRIWVQVHKPWSIGHVLALEVRKVHAELGELALAEPVQRLPPGMDLGLVQCQTLPHCLEGLQLRGQLPLPRLLRGALLLQAAPELALPRGLLLLLQPPDLGEPFMQRLLRSVCLQRHHLVQGHDDSMPRIAAKVPHSLDGAVVRAPWLVQRNPHDVALREGRRSGVTDSARSPPGPESHGHARAE